MIRPTGLIDPVVEVRPAKSQVDDLLGEVKEVARRGYRTLATVLTKRMAEDLTEYLHENGVRVRYMHSDIDTLERIEILRDLRLGAFDVLVGINLLREGLDIPECALVAILDADKEGFFCAPRPRFIQTIGRARPQRRRPLPALCGPESPVPWNAPWPRPTAAARSSSRIMPSTGSRPRASSAPSETS